MFSDTNAVKYGEEYFDFDDELEIEFNVWLKGNGIDIHEEGYVILI
jgi:hypothetical protein